ncbi:MAG: S-layer homology domain-containing protein [Clostridia bacterium]|nr:S-layer homology domain-containing protein [Clostridia bacterium]
MNRTWKKIIIGMCSIMIIAASAVQAADSFADIPLDRVFEENRTLYYVKAADGNTYDLSIDGYTQIKKASSVAQSGVYSSENVTVLKNDSTGKEYRFVFTKPQEERVIEITEVLVTSDGKLTVSGICPTDKKLNVLITMPKEAFSDEAYNYDEIDKSNMEQYVIYTADAKQAVSDDVQILFEYHFPSDARCGTYNIIIIGNETEASKDVYYMSQSEIDRIVSEFDEMSKKETNAANVKTMREYMEKNYKALYLELDYYNQLSDMAKNTVVTLMMNHDGEYAHADIRTEFIKSIATAWANDGKPIDTIVKAYPNDIKLDMYEKYGTLKSKTLVDNSIKSAKDYENLTKIFNRMTALSMLNESEPSGIGDVLKNYNQYLISDKAYEHYRKNESSCIRNITNKNFDSTEKLEQAILSKSESGGTDEGNSGNSGNSGNKGSGSSKSNSGITAPATSHPVIPQTKPENNSLPFTDLKNYSWAYTAIEHLYNNKICSGKDEVTFAPQDNILREEAVKLIVNSFGIESNADTKLDFTDVPEDAWYAEFIKGALASKIAEGISETEFGTGTNITRQDLAVMLYRALKADGRKIDIIIDNKAELNDLDEVSEYAATAVNYLIEIGAITGSDGKFRPHDYITRAEAAQMIYSVIKIR